MSFQWPENIPELVAVGQAIERGSKRSRLRQMAVVCPGPRSHTLIEVYPSGRGPILFTERHLHRGVSEARTTRVVGEMTIEMPEDFGATETIASERYCPSPTPSRSGGCAVAWWWRLRVHGCSLRSRPVSDEWWLHRSCATFTKVVSLPIRHPERRRL